MEYTERELLARIMVAALDLEHSTTAFGVFCGGMATAFAFVRGYIQKKGPDIPSYAEMLKLKEDNVKAHVATKSEKHSKAMLAEGSIWRTMYNQYCRWQNDVASHEKSRSKEFLAFEKALRAMQQMWRRTND